MRCARGPDGYRGVSVVPSNPRFFHGPLALPNGALIESICFALWDADDATDIELSLIRTDVTITGAELLTLASKTPPFSNGYFSAWRCRRRRAVPDAFRVSRRGKLYSNRRREVPASRARQNRLRLMSDLQGQ